MERRGRFIAYYPDGVEYVFQGSIGDKRRAKLELAKGDDEDRALMAVFYAAQRAGLPSTDSFEQWTDAIVDYDAVLSDSQIDSLLANKVVDEGGAILLKSTTAHADEVEAGEVTRATPPTSPASPTSPDSLSETS